MSWPYRPLSQNTHTNDVSQEVQQWPNVSGLYNVFYTTLLRKVHNTLKADNLSSLQWSSSPVFIITFPVLIWIMGTLNILMIKTLKLGLSSWDNTIPTLKLTQI